MNILYIEIYFTVALKYSNHNEGVLIFYVTEEQ